MSMNLAAGGEIVVAWLAGQSDGPTAPADPAGARLAPEGPRAIAEPEGVAIESATAKNTARMQYVGTSAKIISREGYAGQIRAVR